MNESEKNNNLTDFFFKYRGAILGGIIAILLFYTGMFKLLAGLAIIAIGIFIGNYIQKNKDDVKEKLKNFIDRF